ncbi:MAG: aconitate hydratase AcnA [Verrucomicrobiae bacterium]|nr:aconitate hydratase AcnA [Verrucomicrobiae bacterium]
MNHPDPFGVLRKLNVAGERRYFSLPELEKKGVGPIGRLPASIRIVLESVLRNCDGKRIAEADVRRLANWGARAERKDEIPFVVARIILQDFTGVPLLVDLAAMRSAVARLGRDPRVIEPIAPVDLTIDHSVQIDFAGSEDAFDKNLRMEFQRNRERYQFLKWGTQAFKTFRVIPPAIGIIHQVNLEFLARGVLEKDGICHPDTLVGTDSHTTMINGFGIVGWGVGGIEAEASMLGQPLYFLTPDVVGVRMTGKLGEGVTATDLALTVTQLLRKAKVVGKFVEFYGSGAEALPLVDRAVVANMAPEYGATMGFFPMDGENVKYLRETGRSAELCELYEAYYRAQGMFGMPAKGQVEYSADLDLDLGSVRPSVAGPKRPQDRIEISSVKEKWVEIFQKPVSEGGYGKTPDELDRTCPVTVQGQKAMLRHGSVLIASITSCTNTSSPSLMLAAGLLAKKAVEKGVKVPSHVKTSLAPGSRVATEYLQKTGLQDCLDKLGFQTVAYGCATCIGNSGPLETGVEQTVTQKDLVTASVLSGNRNFEARVHPLIKANFLMSPPLVVAFALAGRVDIDLPTEPLGHDSQGRSVYLHDIWPTLEEIRECLRAAMDPGAFERAYRDFARRNPMWNEVPSPKGDVYVWDEASTYIQEPPFFENFSLQPGRMEEIRNARLLGLFGDSVTTDHISPAGNIKGASPAGRYLAAQGVSSQDFNSYGARRGNDRVMTRGTFANVRIKNLMAPGTEGGVTRHHPSGENLSIYDAAVRYRQEGTPLIIMAGIDYGMGSSRDWAAKGTKLLGVCAVIARSFERIHRSNLVGMGILPLQLPEGVTAETLKLDGSETFDLPDLENPRPLQDATLVIHRANGASQKVALKLRIDTPIEVEYYRHGGILPYVLRQLLG